MKKTLSLLMVLMMTGCVGSYVTGREVENQPYPKLQTVPDRPAKKDFSEAQQQLEDFEATYKKSIDENQSLRTVTRPAAEF